MEEMYCWTDSALLRGKFQFSRINDVEDKFAELKLPFFQEYSPGVGRYLRFFEELPIEKKKKLVRFYILFENDFDRIFTNKGLVNQLKYLAPVFSAMNPEAVSKEKRAGVWQLSHFQAVFNGLQVNDLVDERFNVLLSSEAFAQQMNKNVVLFGSYEKAIAAYLYGNTRIRNSTRLVENEGRISDYLPPTFQEYMAVFQAFILFINENTYKYNRTLQTVKQVPDTVKINQQLHLQQVSEVLNISMHQLQDLNLHFKYSIIPGDKETQQLILPHGKWDDFVLWQDSIYNTYDSLLFQLLTQKIEYPPSPNRQYAREQVKDLEIEGKTKIKYRLKTGDVLGIIAENYDVRVADLKYWNNIYNERRIQAGKTLDIFVDDEKADYYLSLSAQEKKKSKEKSKSFDNQVEPGPPVYTDLENATKIEHTVKSGESPYVIAKKYKGVTPDQILEWNNIKDERKIQIGQKLIVYLNDETR